MKRRQEFFWRTGKPTQDGLYLVSLQDGYVSTTYWEGWRDGWECEQYNGRITAWCPLSSIKPYQGFDYGTKRHT